MRMACAQALRRPANWRESRPKTVATQWWRRRQRLLPPGIFDDRPSCLFLAPSRPLRALRRGMIDAKPARRLKPGAILFQRRPGFQAYASPRANFFRNADAATKKGG